MRLGGRRMRGCTAGGSGSIRCTGHHKSDAARMKALIEQRQSEYYRPEVPEAPVS